MSFTPILISVFVVLVVIVVLKQTVWPLIQQNRINRMLMHSGAEADGIILQVNQTGVYVNKLPEVNIQMQVMPSRGQNFVTEFKEIVSFTELPAVKPGVRLKLRYNPRNHKQVIIVRNIY